MSLFRSMAFAAFLASVVAMLGGCRSACDTPEVRRIADTAPVALAIGSARTTANNVQAYVDQNAMLSEVEKTDLRIRAQILAAQADNLDRGHDGYLKHDPDISMRNLEMRRGVLREEQRALVREWMVVQVKYGQRQPKDVLLDLDVTELWKP